MPTVDFVIFFIMFDSQIMPAVNLPAFEILFTYILYTDGVK